MKPHVAQPLAAALLLALAAPAGARVEDAPALCAVTFSLPARPASPKPKAASPDPPRTAASPGWALLAASLWNETLADVPPENPELLPPEGLATLVQRLSAAGQSEDLGELASFAPEARLAIASLRARPGFADYAAWLQNQLDEIDAADLALKPGPEEPAKTAPAARLARVPYYDFWLGRIAARPRPDSAEAFLPSLHAAFVAEGVPPELVWLAETESSFNPRARSPAGARGLFQLMPETARSLGLDLRPDERIHPARSARAAAAYLRHLHGRFGDWPLALAAYNAGESRVARELKRRGAADFAAIARHLPAETRFYVPKVLATVRLRSGVSPENLAAPVPRDS